MSEQHIQSTSANTENPSDFTIFYRPSTQTVASWSVTRLPVERSFDASVASLGCDSGSCVLAGTPVLLADGTTKAIETFTGGEMVRTLSGVSRVRALENPRLGVTRRIIELCVGNEAPLMISDEHAMWMRFEQDGLQTEWWGVYNFNHYLVEKENGIGVRLQRDAKPLRFDVPQTHAHIDGWKHVQPIYHMMHPDTPLYHLDVEEGGSYIAGGFVISSHAVDRDGEGVRWTGAGTHVEADEFLASLANA
ncbi:hypothetical protein Herbaro_10225 [Herbaspirillum sp. WKF16]|uniref:hypothetical protein n=1 Tax=Herbaspirillum sp. WKF16 TaxID=3028312 RepID=UPI0023A99F2A|nr:hypothetical protein [Herbaspirillum sp. WKF16]WDZ98135.1 hypothetical protein Herbaro_10225 [Herbaspirillum sp. WKF16]